MVTVLALMLVTSERGPAGWRAVYSETLQSCAYVQVLQYSGSEGWTGRVQNLVGGVRCEGTLTHQADAARRVALDILTGQRALGLGG